MQEADNGRGFDAVADPHLRLGTARMAGQEAADGAAAQSEFRKGSGRRGTGLAKPAALDEFIAKYRITWTLLPPGTPAIALLDRMPGWKRIHADDIAVVHARTTP